MYNNDFGSRKVNTALLRKMQKFNDAKRLQEELSGRAVVDGASEDAVIGYALDCFAEGMQPEQTIQVVKTTVRECFNPRRSVKISAVPEIVHKTWEQVTTEE